VRRCGLGQRSHSSISTRRRRGGCSRACPTGPSGLFLLYEPTRRLDEDRAAWLDRFERTNQSLWSVLTPAEWDQIWHHVSSCDFPETAAVWCELGREAGFGEAREVFADPTDFFRLFRFEG